MLHLDDKNFDAETSRGNCLVLFGGSWCAPCKANQMILERFENYRRYSIRYYYADVHKCPTAANRFMIQSVPVMVGFDLLGRPQGSLAGLQAEPAIVKFIESFR